VKITRVEVYRAELPFSGGIYSLSRGRTYTGFDATFARVLTDDGSEGWGESTPFGATYVAAHGPGTRAGLTEVAPAVIGLDPRCSDKINDAMDEALAGHLHAKSPSTWLAGISSARRRECRSATCWAGVFPVRFR